LFLSDLDLFLEALLQRGGLGLLLLDASFHVVHFLGLGFELFLLPLLDLFSLSLMQLDLLLVLNLLLVESRDAGLELVNFILVGLLLLELLLCLLGSMQFFDFILQFFDVLLQLLDELLILVQFFTLNLRLAFHVLKFFAELHLCALELGALQLGIIPLLLTVPELFLLLFNILIELSDGRGQLVGLLPFILILVALGLQFLLELDVGLP